MTGNIDDLAAPSATIATRRFLAAQPEIDCAQVACSLVGFEVPSFDSPFNVALRFPARFPRFQYRVELPQLARLRWERPLTPARRSDGYRRSYLNRG